MNTSQNLAIALYGNRESGFGWIANARVNGASLMLGDGALKHHSATDAVFAAVTELQHAPGVERSQLVGIYAGERVAVAPLSNVPWFGQLVWSEGYCQAAQ